MHKTIGLAPGNGSGNMTGGEGGSKAHGATSDGLTKAHNIGLNLGMVTSKQGATTTKAGGYFISNQ